MEQSALRMRETRRQQLVFIKHGQKEKKERLNYNIIYLFLM